MWWKYIRCKGGDPINAFPYIQENELELEKDYPYLCNYYEKFKEKVYILYNKKLYKNILLYYSSGILDDEYNCPQEYEYLNHEVVVVGLCCGKWS